MPHDTMYFIIIFTTLSRLLKAAPGGVRGAIRPAELGLMKQRNALQPSKDLFHPLALFLAHGVAFMPCRALIDGAAASVRVLGYMRRHLQIAQRLYQRKLFV
jgi:hypothetical protein